MLATSNPFTLLLDQGAFHYFIERMERVTGIEPALSAWEAEVMPFHYTRIE